MRHICPDKRLSIMLHANACQEMLAIAGQVAGTAGCCQAGAPGQEAGGAAVGRRLQQHCCPQQIHCPAAGLCQASSERRRAPCRARRTGSTVSACKSPSAWLLTQCPDCWTQHTNVSMLYAEQMSLSRCVVQHGCVLTGNLSCSIVMTFLSCRADSWTAGKQQSQGGLRER